jgi:2-desacetyl-2-hydroxyethyl bacteriochlorophyllide A dehydrogenase
MKTLVCTHPGSLEYKEIPAPGLLPGHAILQIKRIGICGTDLHAYEGVQPYFNYPRILGHELAGDLVEADGAKGFVPGEPVTCIPYIHCGKCIACRNGKTNCCVQLKVLGVHVDGGMVSYLSVPSELLVKSQGLTYDQLALVEPLSIGAHGVWRARLKEHEFVLVMGAGPIGLGTMAFAKMNRAIVIAMDINENRLGFCREKLNIPHCINPSREDVFASMQSITNGEMATAVFDATGNLGAIDSGLQYLAHGGRYVLIGLQKETFSFSHPEFHKREATLMSSRNATRKDFDTVIQSIHEKLIDPGIFISQRVKFGEVKDRFSQWIAPGNNIIKILVDMD